MRPPVQLKRDYLAPSTRDLLKSHKIILFYSKRDDGSITPPSAAGLKMIRDCRIDCATIDITTNPNLTEDLQQYSGWQFFPQLYVNSEFIGGTMVMSEFIASGELLRTSQTHNAVAPRNSVDFKSVLAGYRSGAIWRLDQSSDGGLIAAAKATGEIDIVDTTTRTKVHSVFSHEGWVNVARFASDSRSIFCAGSDTQIRQFQLCQKEGVIVGRHDRWVNDLVTSHDSSSLYTVGADRNVRRWEPGNPNPIFSTKIGDANLWAIARCGSRLCIGDEDGWITSIDREQGSIQARWRAHSNCITSICEGAAYGTICASSYDGTSSVWAVPGREIARFYSGSRVWAVCPTSAESGAMASACDDGNVHVWLPFRSDAIVIMRCPDRPIAVMDVAAANSICIGCADGSLIWYRHGS